MEASLLDFDRFNFDQVNPLTIFTHYMNLVKQNNEEINNETTTTASTTTTPTTTTPTTTDSVAVLLNIEDDTTGRLICMFVYLFANLT